MSVRSSVSGELDPDFEQLVERTRQQPILRLARREGFVEWSCVAVFVATTLALLLFADSARTPSLLTGCLLVGLYAAFSRIDFEVGSGSAVPSQLVFVPMLALLPARLIPVCVAAGLIVGHTPDYLRGKLNPRRVIRLVASALYSVAPAILLVATGEPTATIGHLPVYIAALGAQFLADALISGTRECVPNGTPPRALLMPVAWVFMVDALLFPIGFVTAVAAQTAPNIVILAAPLVVLLVVFSRERSARLTGTLELSHAYRGTAFLLGDVIEADDAYTGSHSRDVVDLVLGVSDQLGLNARERRKAEFTALLHDVGKIRIPGEIINKPGPLDDQERAIINTHTILGQEMLEQIGGLLGEVGTLVRSCHEHFDGTGYPDKLAGEGIPLIARMVCCCDAFNAMTTTRSYRAGLTPKEAIDELHRCSGTQFDPAVVDALLRCRTR